MDLDKLRRDIEHKQKMGWNPTHQDLLDIINELAKFEKEVTEVVKQQVKAIEFIAGNVTPNPDMVGMGDDIDNNWDSD